MSKLLGEVNATGAGDIWEGASNLKTAGSNVRKAAFSDLVTSTMASTPLEDCSGSRLEVLWTFHVTWRV